MKRADTGAVSFIAIEWGQDILNNVQYEEPVYAGELVGDAEQGIVILSASQVSAFENGKILTKGSGIDQIETYGWGKKEGLGEERVGAAVGGGSTRKGGGSEKRNIDKSSSGDVRISSIRVQPSRTTNKMIKNIPY